MIAEINIDALGLNDLVILFIIGVIFIVALTVVMIVIVIK